MPWGSATRGPARLWRSWGAAAPGGRSCATAGSPSWRPPGTGTSTSCGSFLRTGAPPSPGVSPSRTSSARWWPISRRPASCGWSPPGLARPASSGRWTWSRGPSGGWGRCGWPAWISRRWPGPGSISGMSTASSGTSPGAPGPGWCSKGPPHQLPHPFGSDAVDQVCRERPRVHRRRVLPRGTGQPQGRHPDLVRPQPDRRPERRSHPSRHVGSDLGQGAVGHSGQSAEAVVHGGVGDLLLLLAQRVMEEPARELVGGLHRIVVPLLLLLGALLLSPVHGVLGLLLFFVDLGELPIEMQELRHRPGGGEPCGQPCGGSLPYIGLWIVHLDPPLGEEVEQTACPG